MIDHPGFSDLDYKSRRDMITKIALNYNLFDKEIPLIKYNDQEQGVWTFCYKRLKVLFDQIACTPHNEALEQMEKHCGFS
jgi:phenylalanine-4-hydroxylase